MKSWFTARPASLALAAILLVLAIATRSLPLGPDPRLSAAIGLDIDSLFVRGEVWRLLTSVVFARAIDLPIALVALVFAMGACERLIGTGRVVLVWVATAVVGGAVGTGLQAAGLLARGLWVTPPATSVVLDPMSPIIGVVMGASAFAGPLWRRRIRLVGLAAIIVLLLYSGQPGDLNRLASAVTGIVLGGLLASPLPRLQFVRSSHHEARSLIAAVVAVAAIGPVVAVVQPTGYGLLRPFGRLFRDTLPDTGRMHDACSAFTERAGCARELLLARLNGPGAFVLTVLPLLVLLVAAFAIQRGRRVGAWLAIGVNGLFAFIAAIYYGLFPVLGDPDQIEDIRSGITVQSTLAVLVSLSIAVWVAFGLRHLTVRPKTRSLALGAGVFAAVVVTVSVLYVVLGSIFRMQFRPAPTPLALLLELPERFVPVGFLRFRRLDFVPVGPVAQFLEGWIGPIAWLTLLIVGAVLAGSVRSTASSLDLTRVQALLRTGSRGSIAWMATWAENRYWFSADARHAVAYREGSGVALTVGEPIGPDEGAIEAARAFAVHCDDLGLIPAFYSVRPEFADSLGAAGARWSSIEVGEDTVIDPGSFTMKGKHWQDVRSSVNRADRLGIRSVWTSWDDLPLGWRTQIESISEEWIADKRLPELGFTLGGIEELAAREVRLMLAVGSGDRIEAVTSWLPTWRDGEIVGQTLDFMRRRSESPNGVMEFVIAAVIALAGQRGLRFVSLSVAPLAGESAEGDARIHRLLESLGRLLEPAYGFRSLAKYKQKFRPQHLPQVLAYADAVALPAITVAVARAYLPDINLPAVGRLFSTRRPEDDEPALLRAAVVEAAAARPETPQAEPESSPEADEAAAEPVLRSADAPGDPSPSLPRRGLTP